MVASLIVGAARVAGKQAAEQAGKAIPRYSKVWTQRYDLRSRKTPNPTRVRNARKKMNRVLRSFFNEETGIDSGDISVEAITKNPPALPEFPYLIFALAVLKDLLDIPLEITIIGIILTTIFSFLIAFVIFFWCRGKMSGGWWKKKLIRWIWNRYILMVLAELIPFIKMVPVTTIFILMVHYRETKLVKLALLALDELKRLGLLQFAK